MPLSNQEISDRLEINDLLTRYCTAIDAKDYELLDECFTPDAKVDYVSSGGIAGSYPEARAWLEMALAPFPLRLQSLTSEDGKRWGNTSPEGQIPDPSTRERTWRGYEVHF